MKRVGVVLFIGLIIVSCNQNVDSENAVEQATKKIEVEEVLQIDENTDYSEIGFQLMETESIGSLKLEMKVEDIEIATGEPHDVTDFEYWGADGYEHQSRFYQDSTIDIDFIKLDNGDIVSNMIFIKNNPEFKTSNNVGVGSTTQDIIKAYNGQISDFSNSSTIVGTIYGGIFFYLDDDKVTSFFLGASTE